MASGNSGKPVIRNVLVWRFHVAIFWLDLYLVRYELRLVEYFLIGETGSEEKTVVHLGQVFFVHSCFYSSHHCSHALFFVGQHKCFIATLMP